MPTFFHDRTEFYYQDSGPGFPFVFQHGLGGDVNQPFGLFHPPAGLRLLAFDARAHGRTQPLGDLSRLSFQTFGADLEAFLNHLGVERAVIGGISMGAALALHFALSRPKRVLGLVLSRPAWLEGPYPWNVQMFTLIAGLIRRHGARQGLLEFQQTPEYLAALAEWPDVAQSFCSQFLADRAEETAQKLERIIMDSPHPDRSQWAGIAVPTLVLGNRQDPIHPFSFAMEMAAAIPGAEFQEITSKSVSVDRHTADVQRGMEDFLQRHFLAPLNS